MFSCLDILNEGTGLNELNYHPSQEEIKALMTLCKSECEKQFNLSQRYQQETLSLKSFNLQNKLIEYDMTFMNG